MDSLLHAGIGAVAFVSTDIDDILLLSAFFADPRLRGRTVVAGQFLGIAILVATSAAVSALALAIPDGWVALLGLVPVWLGLRGLHALRHSDDMAEDADSGLTLPDGSRLLAVAGVTLANGGDNLGVYIPLFASAPGAFPAYVAVFAAMTALWCWLGYRLVNARWAGTHVKRYGHTLLPVVLVALGAYILTGALVLFR